MSVPKVLRPPSDVYSYTLPDLILNYMETLHNPIYGYGWDTPTSLPIRSDSADYVSDEFYGAIREARTGNIPLPEAWIDSAGVPTLRFSNKQRAVHYGFPCYGVLRWARTTKDEDTGSEGVEKNLSHDDMVQILNNDFDWLWRRTQQERDWKKDDQKRPYR